MRTINRSIHDECGYKKNEKVSGNNYKIEDNINECTIIRKIIIIIKVYNNTHTHTYKKFRINT